MGAATGWWKDRRRAGRFLDAEGQRIEAYVDGLAQRGKVTGRDRVRQLQIYSVLAVQAGIAAALASVASFEIIGNRNPVFAPIAAVGTVAASVGQRLRRSVELVIGVALGIGVSDAFLSLIGRGAWQTGLIVTLSIIVAVTLTGRGGLLTQAGGTAVLVATVSPASPTGEHIEAPQLVNAAIGGLAGLVVVVLLVPLNPLRIVERAAGPAVDELATQLQVTARALASRDSGLAQGALERLRRIGTELDRFSEALEGAKEAVNLAPARWHRRRALARYETGAKHVDRVLGNSRGLIRRAVTLIEDDEPIPASMPGAVAHLGEAIRLLHRDLRSRRIPERARGRALDAVSDAGRAWQEGTDLSGTVVVAQVRTAASDLLRATGLSKEDANQLVRRAAGPAARPSAGPGAAQR